MGDSMICDFSGRRPLPVRDYVVSIEVGPELWNHVSKVWRLLVWLIKTDQKLDVKTSFFVVIKDHPRTIQHSPLPAGVSGQWNLKNHWISPSPASKYYFRDDDQSNEKTRIINLILPCQKFSFFYFSEFLLTINTLSISHSAPQLEEAHKLWLNLP